MNQIGRSEAYREGMKAKTYENPYEPGTQQFNEFERGWSQRIKRGGSYASIIPKPCYEMNQPLSLQEIYADKPVNKPTPSKYNSYANAKGK
ncbi:hypothetical protein [Vibrio scophthalmi]|uniref:Uncharacterized protein n=1 Tax=Vibrio scophthalmi TaxID=45658 RepID=A0A1E3WER4_9VIBR|nr:hypothetical protein [Vibrio scophthalmi]ODS04291.1 hypothetical protein VSF3289_03422 [Vibrio scophthalmi]